MATSPNFGLDAIRAKSIAQAKSQAFGFVGPSYTNSSLFAAGEETINLYPEAIESGHGLNSLFLRKCPGLTAPICTLPTSPVRGQRDVSGRHFVVAGHKFYEVHDDGTFVDYGSVGLPASSVVSMADSGDQILIVGIDVTPTGFDLRSSALTPLPACPATAFQCGFVDGYFVVLLSDSKQFQLSGQFDMTKWSGLDFAAKAGAGDEAAAILVDHEQLWLFGQKTTEIWYNAGGASFPMQRVPQAVLPMGCDSYATAVCLDNTVFWKGGNKDGGNVVYRASGWTPVRISNHAMESQIQGYARTDDAYAWPYQQDGHSFYMLTFPSAIAQIVYVGGNQPPDTRYQGVTWCYDVATGMWHKRLYWEAATGTYQAHLGFSHAYSFGMHLVGDRQSGNIYQMDSGTYHDNGQPLRWLRSAPHLSSEERWNFYHSLQLYMQVGTGEQVVLQMSRDSGNTWGQEIARTAGEVGEFKPRVKWNRLGRARNAAFRAFGTGNCPTAIIDAYIDVRPGNGS